MGWMHVQSEFMSGCKTGHKTLREKLMVAKQDIDTERKAISNVI